MTRLYVAGPMSGLPDFNYPAFNHAADRLRAFGYETLNPADLEALNPTAGVPQKWDWYMRHALRMVLDSEAIALLPGWELSRGANLELHIADQLGMPVKAWHTWLCDTGTAAEPCPGCPDCSGVHNSIPEFDFSALEAEA